MAVREEREKKGEMGGKKKTSSFLKRKVGDGVKERERERDEEDREGSR